MRVVGVNSRPLRARLGERWRKTCRPRLAEGESPNPLVVARRSDYPQHIGRSCIMDSREHPVQMAKLARNLSVLLVEDDPGVAQVAATWVRNLHCEVTVASNGTEAEKIAAQHN